MAKNHFADMFRISQESADSTATELPVVLKVAVEPAEGGADVAQDPAVAPAADAPAAADAGSADTNVEDGSTPVAPVAAPAVPAAAPQPVETAPVADDDEDQTIADVEQQMVAANSEQGLAESNSEIDNISQDMEVAEDAVAEAKDQMEVQEEILKNPETVTPASVAIAVQNFKSILKRVGMDESVAPSIQHVSFESMISKENGGLGSSPAAALRIVHEDMGKFVEGAKNAMIKLWEAIKAAFSKMIEFVKNIFFSVKKQGQALIDQIKKNYPEKPDGKFKPYTVFPTLKTNPVLQGNIANIKKYNDSTVSGCILLHNEITKFLNETQFTEEARNDGKANEIVNEFAESIVEQFKQGKFGNTKVYENDKGVAVVCGKDYIVTVPHSSSKGNNGLGFNTEVIKAEPIDEEVNLPSKSELINGLNSVISYDVAGSTKKLNEIIDQAAKLTEVLAKKTEKSWIAGKSLNLLVRFVYGQLVKEVTKANVSINKGAIEYGALALKAGSENGPQK